MWIRPCVAWPTNNWFYTSYVRSLLYFFLPVSLRKWWGKKTFPEDYPPWPARGSGFRLECHGFDCSVWNSRSTFGISSVPKHMMSMNNYILLREYGELSTLEHAGGTVLQRERLAPAGECDAEAPHPVRLGVGLFRQADWAHLKSRWTEAPKNTILIL